MNEIKFDSNMFINGMHLMCSTKTGTNLIKEEERLCDTCENYKGKLKCRILGKIKNPNCSDCSWWKFKGLIKK